MIPVSQYLNDLDLYVKSLPLAQQCGVVIAILLAVFLGSLRESRYIRVCVLAIIAAPTFVFALELILSAIREKNAFYTLDHYLAFVFLSAPFCIFEAICAKDSEKSRWPRLWVIFGAAVYWCGIAVLLYWSYQNELAVYWNKTPPRAGDWHHWTADLLGLATMYMVRRYLYLAAPFPRLAPAAA